MTLTEGVHLAQKLGWKISIETEEIDGDPVLFVMAIHEKRGILKRFGYKKEGYFSIAQTIAGTVTSALLDREIKAHLNPVIIFDESLIVNDE